MENQHFDSLTRRLGTTTSRRQTVRVLAASTLAITLGHVAADDAAAGTCRHLTEPCTRRRQCCGARKHRDVHCEDFRELDRTQPRVCCLGEKGAPCDSTMTPEPCCGALACIGGTCMA